MDTLTRDNQKTDVIYVAPGKGAIVTPDGVGRYFYDRHYYRDMEIDTPADLPDLSELDDDDAAIEVARYEHGEDLPVEYVDYVDED